MLVFLTVFFVFEMLTSGTEEIGWSSYLNEKLRQGRDFWKTGWAVGLPWAAWHTRLSCSCSSNKAWALFR